jgi:flagellum-specific ATP synthase
MPGCNTAEENAVVDRARRLLATYEDMAELIRLGAYRRGSDPEIDEAIHYMPALEAFLRQTGEDKTELQATYTTLAAILGIPAGTEPSPDDGREGDLG